MLHRQLVNELHKLFARKRTYIGFGAFLLLQAAILALLQHPRAKAELRGVLERQGVAFDEYYQGLTMAVAIIVFTFTLLGALYVALVAGDIVAKEVEDGTMRMMLARPSSRLRLLMVKAAAVAIYTVLLVWFLAGSALVIAWLYRGRLGGLVIFIPEEDIFSVFAQGEGLMRYARAVAFLSFSTLSIAAMAFMFSCFNMKPAAATILTLSVFFIDFVLRTLPYFMSIRHYFLTYHFGMWVRTFAVPEPWPHITESVIVLTVAIGTFLTIGITRFCTRDLKS